MQRERITTRHARADDILPLRRMHRLSLRGLAGKDYGPAEIDGLLATVETVDPRLIADATYHVAEIDGALAGSGGWTMRRPDYEAHLEGRPDEPRLATIRAIFVHPAFARRGVARRIMEVAETEAVLFGGAEGFELVATLTGVPLYRALGYRPTRHVELPLGNGGVFRGVRMTKPVVDAPVAAHSAAPALAA